ncbi:MAG: prolyl oligopeptidase family serine peptidase [Gemmatimonadota bacterium]|nr:prolyl oligopeptidase family serine peptidase [Gemmatimonadota bacterium]
MNTRPTVLPIGRFLAAALLPLLVALPATSALAQAKKVLSVEDYSTWRTIDAAQISPDGKWVVYGLRFTNVVTPDAKPELHIKRLDTGVEVVVKDASQPQFSPDSRWVVYQVEPPPPPKAPVRGAAGAAGAQPAPADSAADTTAAGRASAAKQEPKRVELRELATGRIQKWEDIATATFSPTSSHLLLRRRPPTAGGASGGDGGAPQGPPGGQGGRGGRGGSGSVSGTDALLVDLAAGRSQFLGSVGDAAFNRRGEMLAYSVEATPKDGNGLSVIDLATGATTPLDNDARTYSGIAWNDAGTGVAVLKGTEVPKMREKENVLLVIPAVRPAAGAKAAPTQARVSLDSSAAGLPKGFVISERAPLSWSDDNARVFFGLIPQTTAPDTGRKKSTDSIADVDVWRTQDERIQSEQMIRANADRNRTFRQALDLKSGKFVALSDSSLRDLEVSPDGRWAVGQDQRPYVTDSGRTRADVYRVHTSTGERTLISKAQLVGEYAPGFSADGRHWLYWSDAKYQDYDLDAGVSRTLAPAGAPSFTDMEWDYPGTRPPYGVEGFSKDGRGVIVQARYDLWYLPYAANAAARNLTNGEGAKGEVIYRWARTVPPDPMAPRVEREGRVIDLAKPVTLSAYGFWTKRSGFSELNGSALKPLVYEDASFSTPQRAAKAEQYLFTRQTFAEFPDVRVSGPGFAQAVKVSNANPQQADYLWGHRILFDFTLKDGTRSQGILALPDDYKAGEKRPMLVTFYEKNSQNLNRYLAPNFLTSMGSTPMEAVSRGYVTMMPDVYFRTGQSHSDMLEAVEAATQKVIEMGYADPAHIGVHGHSYGGEGAAFISTRSQLFAAVGMGAGVTDLTSDFVQSWGWSYQVTGGSGQNGSEYYINSQGRWGFSPWDKPEIYRFESALTHVRAVRQPILIMHGTADPTVSFSEGMNFYNALRYNNKVAYMLAYPGEGHGLRGVANRRDLTIRYFQFFDHYLRGAPAPRWMTDGVPYLVKESVKEPK